jgi:hypothetical protein
MECIWYSGGKNTVIAKPRLAVVLILDLEQVMEPLLAQFSSSENE